MEKHRTKMSAQCRPLEPDGVHEFMRIAMGEVLVFGENNVVQKPPRKRAKALWIRQGRQLPHHRWTRQHAHEELQMQKVGLVQMNQLRPLMDDFRTESKR
jgi:hypothetical protein